MSEILDIAEWKTAAYSFELPLQAAGILADAPDEVVAALGAVGRCLGVAFQLQDDLDGVFGSAERTGKDPLGDLREGKCTALVAIARSGRWWEELAAHVGNPDLTPDDARHARDLLVACGARRGVEMLVRDLSHAAATVAATLPAPVRDALDELVNALLPGTPATTLATAAPSAGATASRPGATAPPPATTAPSAGIAVQPVGPRPVRARVRGAA